MKQPPEEAIKFLHWFCRRDLADEIEGDLREQYAALPESRYMNRLRFWLWVLAFLRPRFIRGTHFQLTTSSMLRNYMVLALRNMRKRPLFSFINIAGLSTGLACVVVISGYILFMLSYDRMYDNAANLYRLTMQWTDDGVEIHTAMTVSPVADVLEGGVRGVKRVARVFPYSGLVSKDGIEKLREVKFCFADSLFFEMFTLPAKHGRLEGALDKPFSVVLTEKSAIKHFGRTDVVDEELIFEDERRAHRFHVTAVIKDLPQNVHLNPDFIASFNTLDVIMPWYNNWHYPPMYLYVEADNNYDRAMLEQALQKQIVSHHPAYVKANDRKYFLQPVTDIYLHSSLASEWQPNSNYAYVQTLILIALFILLLACINYVNLSTARGVERAKEVGVRKAMGAYRRQLVSQFLGEALLTTLLSFALAIMIAETVFTLFVNPLLSKDISVLTAFPPLYAGIAVALFFLVSLVAGLYPAIFLSHFGPISVVGSVTGVRGKVTFRTILVGFQFTVSCLLIIGMLIIDDQVSFMRNKKLGFEKEQLVAIKLFDRKSTRNYSQLKDQLIRESIVKSVSVASTFPLKDGFYGWPITPEGHTAEEQMNMKAMSGDEDIVKTLNLELIAGRDFSTRTGADEAQAFIINKAAARMLRWTEPIGKEFQLTFFADSAHQRKGKVIGVVNDFHFESLYNQIEPLVIFVNKHPYYCDYLLVKLGPGNLAASLDLLEQNWKEFNPDKPFEFSLADDELSNLYTEERKLSKMFSSFTLVSLLISALGLFGLSAYSISQRTKEIGIRKVLGASAGSLYHLLSQEYLLIMVISQIISWPLAWALTNQWLDGFAYRTDVSLGVFLITLVIGFLLGLLSVSMHIFRATRANPTSALRTE